MSHRARTSVTSYYLCLSSRFLGLRIRNPQLTCSQCSKCLVGGSREPIWSWATFTLLYHFDQLFGHRSQRLSKRGLCRFITHHNGDRRDGHNFSAPWLFNTAQGPEILSAEMSEKSQLIPDPEEMLISSWGSQVTWAEDLVQIVRYLLAWWQPQNCGYLEQ